MSAKKNVIKKTINTINTECKKTKNTDMVGDLKPMKVPEIHISKGNSKMGTIPYFSLPAGRTCSKEACKTCYQQGCYGRKIARLRPNVANCEKNNLMFAMQYPDTLEKYLDAYFSIPNSPKVFRIHENGDFFSEQYLQMWLRIIEKHEDVTFWAFTKQKDIILPYIDKLPKNFKLTWSAWPGVPVPRIIRQKLPIAWMQDGTETRIPKDAVECSGHCETCGRCWTFNGCDTWFRKH